MGRSSSAGTRRSRGRSPASRSSRGCRSSDDPSLCWRSSQARFATGTHELYQLLLARPDGADGARRARRGDRADALLDGVDAARRDRRLPTLGRADPRVDAGRRSRRAGRRSRPRSTRATSDARRPIGVEQSNSSIVFDDRLVLKVFRKLEPGINPELELLRFLTAHGFPNIAPLHGWYEYDGPGRSRRRSASRSSSCPRRSTAGSWRSTRSPSTPSGSSTGSEASARSRRELHTVLASDAGDPAFAPEEPSRSRSSLLTATIDEDIERIFVRLPDDERRGADRRPRAGRARAARAPARRSASAGA